MLCYGKLWFGTKICIILVGNMGLGYLVFNIWVSLVSYGELWVFVNSPMFPCVLEQTERDMNLVLQVVS